MQSTPRHFPCRHALAAALLMAFGSAHAQAAAEGVAMPAPAPAATPAATPAAAPTPDEIRKDLYTIASSATVGFGYVSANNRRFGQYTGMTHQGGYALLDVDLIQRDEATGSWLKIRGRNLGLPDRELRLSNERQGDWGWWVQDNQMTRREPLIVNTGLQGLGTGKQVVSATAPKRDIDLRIDHDILALGARKFVAAGLDVEISFKQDSSQGDRMMGRGTSNVMEFLTEPIDRVTRQWQVVAGYADRKMQFSGGYSGSSYDNRIPVLSSTGGNGAASAFGASWDMALPPSNTAHQLHLSGGFNPNETTRTSFKLSRTIAEQDQAFAPIFTRLAGAPESLGGKVTTTLAYVDLTLRPLKAVDIVAALRYEDRDDETPESRFLLDAPATVGGSYSIAGATGLYKPRSLRQQKGTLDAGWRLDGGYRVSAGLEQEDLRRNVSAKYRRVAFRERTDENTMRLDFKRTMSEVLNGSVALLHSDRTGSDYVPDTYDPNALTNQVNALLWADRRRDKLRLAADWLPSERWSVQGLADISRDSYSGRAMGPRKGNANYVSADANYRLDERWTFTGWVSQESTLSRQSDRSDRVGSAAAGYDTLWQTDLRVATRAAGISVRGTPRATLQLGADFSGSTDVVEHNLAQTGGSGTLGVNSLPTYFYRQYTLKLFAEQAVQPMAGVRVELAFDHRRNNDWTWQNWTYNGAPAIAAAARTSDGTTVRNMPSENVAFVGVSYRFRWR